MDEKWWISKICGDPPLAKFPAFVTRDQNKNKIDNAYINHQKVLAEKVLAKKLFQTKFKFVFFSRTNKEKQLESAMGKK